MNEKEWYDINESMSKNYLNVLKRAHVSSERVKYVVAGAGQSNDIPLRVPATAQYSCKRTFAKFSVSGEGHFFVEKADQRLHN